MKLFNLSTDMIGRPPKPMLRGKIWYIRQRIAGKDCWRSLHTGDKREAQYLALEIWRERQSDRIKQIIPAPPVKIDTIWERYRATEKYKELAESTKDSKQRVWKAFFAWCNESKLLYPEQVTTNLAMCYLSSGQRKNKTFNNILIDLRTVFSVIEDDKNVFCKIDPLPTRRVRKEKRSEQFRALTDDEMNHIEEALPASRMAHKDEWLLAAKIARNTGLRFKDVSLLRWDQIHSDELGQYIVLSPNKTNKATDGKEVYIRLIPKFSVQIGIWRTKSCSEYVLPEMAEKYKKDWVHAGQPFGRFCRTIGIEDCSFHCYRVSIITKAAQAGVDLEEFGGVVGHTTEAQTKAYNRAAINIDMERILSVKLA